MYFEHYANMFQHNLNHNKTSFWVVSTQIDILIQRYLRNLRKKSAVKYVHIERNITPNIQPFQLVLIAVLSHRCHDSDLV